MLVLPLQALAGMTRVHGPHTERHGVHGMHSVHGVYAPTHAHVDGVQPVAQALPDAPTSEAAAMQTACAHHESPACPACEWPSADSSDRSNLPPSCNTCSSCCLLLIPAPLTLLPPAGTNSSPAEREARFRSVSPHILERPPRSFMAA
jgi:hypothetical protein